MRIIGGKYGGRIIKAPRGYRTHPMGDRIRMALFNALGDLSDASVLDAFAGSGALAIEAASRGATDVVATEIDNKAYKTAKGNIERLGVHEVQLVKANVKSWSSTNVDKLFDIIFCDPPYNNTQLSTVFALQRHLKPNGLMVLSYPGSEETPTADGVVVVDNRNYGDAALAYYRKR